ncbi:meiosis regulator and mRNA stability factor 1-like isoform X2 [Artemia franciscana]|uniref:meiosis regulator and mRNA stability factor 1-like isoform X2 n=1 Tax=Artemia franciscana TaxID=6661 RepID=UPI0032DBB161
MENEHKNLVGIFWDIENIRIPKGTSTIDTIEAIRKRFCSDGEIELEFQVVCDIRKESPAVVQGLNSLQVTVVHIDAISKNAADDKLRQLIRRFGDVHGDRAKIIVLTGDVNFSTDLADLKRRKKCQIILLHNRHATRSLLLSASENYLFEEIVQRGVTNVAEKTDIPVRPHEFTMFNLPVGAPRGRVLSCLSRLGDNTGCRVESLERGKAILKFVDKTSAERARIRMDGAVVCGTLTSSSKVRPSPLPEMAQPKDKISSREVPMDECCLPEVKPMLLPQTMIPEESFSPLLTPKGFVMPNMFSPYIQKMGPFPPPPNPVEIGLPITMSSSNPNPSTTEKPTAMSSSPECDPWMVSQLLKDTPPPTVRGPDMEASMIEMKNPEIFDNPVYASLTQTPEGYRKIKKKNSEMGQSSGSLRSVTKAYRYTPPMHMTIPPPPCFTAPPPTAMDMSFTSVSDIDSRNRSIDGCVDLHITNLDQTIQAREMKRILGQTFSQHVEVLQVFIHYLADGVYTACVRVRNQEAGQIAISNFHRARIGKKRIMISYYNNQGKPSALLRSEVKSLLAEVPNNTLPLFRFREVFERRFNASISVSDLYRMKDIVTITDENGNGRMISLARDSRVLTDDCGGVSEFLRSSVCQTHYQLPREGTGGWAEREAKFDLPNVCISLKDFEPKLKYLIETHDGILYLNSLPDCYKAVYGPLPVAKDELQGVPLEHLVTRVRGVKLVKMPSSGVKHLEMTEVSENEDSFGSSAAKPLNLSLATELEMLSREVIDLLRSNPNCRIPFSKFVPSYHRHYGKQCRVATYGFTRLIDLLEAIGHTVQVLDEGAKQQLTLTAGAQVKRFTTDLQRLLKSQPGKQVLLSQFSPVYEKAYGKSFSPINYGVCFFDDLLADLSDIVVITSIEGDKIISLPKREQTPDEIERTKQFAAEAVELLSHAPEFSINFNKFIPAYHHHFGRQCKVADHGFLKLIDLFEAIPEAIKIVDDHDGEKWLHLTSKEQLRIFGNQVVALIKMTKMHALYLSELPELYCQVYGFSLRPESYDVTSVEEVCDLISNIVKVSVEQNTARLAPIELFRHNLVKLLKDRGGQMSMSGFDKAYLKMFNVPCRPAVYGFVSVAGLVSSLSEIVFVKGSGQKKAIFLKEEAENVYSKNPVLSSPKEKPGCNSTLTTGNGSLFRNLKDKNEKGRNGKHLDGFFQKFQNHIRDPNPANSCSGNKEVIQAVQSYPPPVATYNVIPHRMTQQFTQQQQVAAYPLSVQFGLNFQLGMHTPAALPHTFINGQQPNMIVVPNYTQIYPNSEQADFQVHETNSEACSYQFPAALNYNVVSQ